MGNMYLFFSEQIHFLNIFIGNAYRSSLPLLIFAVVAGILFRVTITTKRSFHSTLAGVFIVWLIGQIIYSYVGMNDLIDYIWLSQPFFNINWLLSTFFVTAWITHIVFHVLHKRPLK